jgi:heptosyltransferase-1
VPRILLVKTSSMGDVIHNLPIVADIRSRFPDADIHWLVEEGFAEIPRLHPGVNAVITVALRRWRKRLWQPSAWGEIAELRRTLKTTPYDFILDTQGLLKSALLGRMATGVHIGYARTCAREPLAARFYERSFHVDPAAHAVVRYRALAAQAFELPPALPLDYGIPTPAAAPAWAPPAPYAVLLHATSRDEKLWPEDDWVALGAHLGQRGLAALLPWGDAGERDRARRLAARIDGSAVAPPMGLAEAAALLAHSRIVIGVDTGLVHLATAVGTPTIGIYCGSDPARNGLYAATPIANLGRDGAPPRASDVIEQVDGMLRP